MGGFLNPIVGGTALRIPAIQSPDYVAGVSGWIVRIDGSAEFNNITIRGSGTTTAVVVGPSTGPQVTIGSTASAGFIQFPTNRPIESHISTIIAAVQNSGLANENSTLQIQGPSVTGATDRCEIQINSQNNDGSSNANFNFNAGSASIAYDQTTFVISNQAGTASALRVNTAAGHTGNMFRLQINGTDQFVVDNGGTLTTYAANTFTSYTPTVTGGGTATFTTQTGWWQRRGKMIDFAAYLVVNAAGSGAANVQINAPVSIDRTTRQRVGVTSEGLSAGNNGCGQLVSFTGGSGATFDRFRNSTGANVTGVDLLAGALIVAEGSVREA